jgi:hypothetical protein
MRRRRSYHQITAFQTAVLQHKLRRCVQLHQHQQGSLQRKSVALHPPPPLAASACNQRHNQQTPAAQQGYKSALILLIAMGAVRYNKRSVRPFQFKHSFLSQLAHLVIENDANASAGENRQDSSRPASRWLSQVKYAALFVHHESCHHRATRMP